MTKLEENASERKLQQTEARMKGGINLMITQEGAQDKKELKNQRRTTEARQIGTPLDAPK